MGSKILFDGAYVVLVGARDKHDFVTCRYAGANQYMVDGHLYRRDGAGRDDGAPPIDFIYTREQAILEGYITRDEPYGSKGTPRSADPYYFPDRKRTVA